MTHAEPSLHLFADLDELTLAQAYWQSGQTASATFSLFFRKYPPDRGYFVFAGRNPILIRTDMATADIAGLAAAAEVLTAGGGRTSHAAVVARQLNKICVVSYPGLVLQEHGRGCRIGSVLLEEGATVSLDGHSGRVYAGRVEVVVERPASYLREVEHWKTQRGTALSPLDPLVAAARQDPGSAADQG